MCYINKCIVIHAQKIKSNNDSINNTIISINSIGNSFYINYNGFIEMKKHIIYIGDIGIVNPVNTNHNPIKNVSNL